MARVALAILCSLVLIGQAVAQQFDAYADVEQRIEQSYAAAMAEYDDAIATQSGDIALEIRRCQVADAFVYATDYYIEELEQVASKCYADLLSHYPGLLAAEIANLSELDSEAAIATIKQIHESDVWRWNTSQNATLHELASQHYQYLDDESDLYVFHCVRALQIDRRANCRLTVARHFVDIDEPDKAISILSSPLDPHDGSYYLLQKLAILSELGAADEVKAQYLRIDFETVGDYQYVELASQLANVGLKYEAMAALNQISGDYWDHDQLARVKFDVSLAIGDSDAALLNYNLMRDLGIHTDPFLRARIDLAVHDTSLAWRALDMLAIFPIIGATLLIAALTWIVPAMVHYRGLARRARALGPGMISTQWTLRHAWYVLFSIAFGSVLTLFIFEYDVLITEFNPESLDFADWAQVDVVRLLIAESFIVPLFLIPLLIGRERLRQFWTKDWSIGRCITIAFVAAFLLRVAYFVSLNLWGEFVGAGQTMSTEEAISDMYLQHGALVTYLLIALLTPLVEEFMFRGVLLQGFARHISFAWANILQAAIFASLHDSMIAFPLLFAFGLVAGILARKAGGLLSAIILHIFFNITAIVANTTAIT